MMKEYCKSLEKVLGKGKISFIVQIQNITVLFPLAIMYEMYSKFTEGH